MGEVIIIICIALVIYAIWLFFFPIILIQRLNEIIELMKKST